MVHPRGASGEYDDTLILFFAELGSYATWFNLHRPHAANRRIRSRTSRSSLWAACFLVLAVCQSWTQSPDSGRDASGFLADLEGGGWNAVCVMPVTVPAQFDGPTTYAGPLQGRSRTVHVIRPRFPQPICVWTGGNGP